MDSELEALEAAAEGLSAPLGCSTEFSLPFGPAENLDLRPPVSSGGASRSPSFDPSDHPQQSEYGVGSVVLPQSEGEREWYSEVNLSGSGTARGSWEAISSSGRGTPEGRAKDFLSSGLSAPVAPGPFTVGSAVAFAHQSLPSADIKRCWEQGFWSQIFGPPCDPFEGMVGTGFKRPEAPLLEVDAEPRPKLLKSSGPFVGAIQSSAYLHAVKDRESVGWKQKRDKERSEALGLWGALLETWPSSLDVIGQLMQLPPESRSAMVEDLLGHKAPATLRKRYRSILGYDSFLRSRGLEFPGSEEVFYMYLCQMREEGKPASSRKALLEAVTFVRFVLGIPSLKALGESKRCHGSTRQKEFRPRKQASPFTVEELSRLHLILAQDHEPWNRLMAGTTLLAVYGRTRWEDLEHAETLLVDKDSGGTAAYIEAGVGVHKTMGAKLMRGQLLPIVAPAVGVVEGNWVEQYIQARRLLRVQDPPEGPVMPAPDRQGMPTVRSLESDEAGSWIRLLLYNCTEQLKDRRVSSHSCKCTCISFATKYGASPDELLLLGYHTGDFKMPLTYGRDAAAPTLLLLEKIFKDIRRGAFRPDCTRSGRFVQGPGSLIVEIKDEEEEPLIPGGSPVLDGQAADLETPLEKQISEAGTTDSDSSSDSGEAAEQRGRPSFTRWVIPDPPVGMRYLEHVKSRVLHLAREGHTKLFACGRAIGVHHREMRDRPEQACSRCRLCAKIADEC